MVRLVHSHLALAQAKSNTYWLPSVCGLKSQRHLQPILRGGEENPHTVTPKDIILSIIRRIGTAGATGTVIDRGNTISEPQWMTADDNFVTCLLKQAQEQA